MGKQPEIPAANPGSLFEPARNGAKPEPELELYDELGLIPTFPQRGVDEYGRLLPISDEERTARHSVAMRALAALDKLPDNDPPDAFIEMMRGLDSRRPPGYKHFEGCTDLCRGRTMLDILATPFRTRTGLSRRSLLRVGMLGMAGLTLADLLRLRAGAAEQGRPAAETAVIQVFLEGGPSHIDTFDPKPDAPAEFRGEFRPIAGSVAGMEVCELLPRMARVMDKVALLRSVHHSSADHGVGTHWIMTGFPGELSHRENVRPSVGAIVARLRGANAPGVPPYVALPDAPAFGQGAYLGPGGNPFSPDGDIQADARVRSLEPPPSLTLDRLDDRRGLLARLDRIERARDASGVMEGMDRFTAEAYAMVTGPRARAAFDLSREQSRLRDRYGRTRVGQACLLARRLVEAGVTFVTVVEGGWDHHGQLFAGCRRQLPALDAALASLVEDLHERGLHKRVLVVVWGEFGRTPRVNGQGGRDHWPGCMSVLMAGGGLRMGQVIGATGRRGEAPVDRALRPEDVLRTVYTVLAIDPYHEFRNDAGRPLAVLNQGQPITELLASGA